MKLSVIKAYSYLNLAHQLPLHNAGLIWAHTRSVRQSESLLAGVGTTVKSSVCCIHSPTPAVSSSICTKDVFWGAGPRCLRAPALFKGNVHTFLCAITNEPSRIAKTDLANVHVHFAHSEVGLAFATDANLFLP